MFTVVVLNFENFIWQHCTRYKLFYFYRPKQPYRVFNTWMGDPSKLIILEEVIKIIQRESLLENVNKTGSVLMNGLYEYQKKYSNLVNSVRGLGTFISFNLPTTQQRDTVVAKLKAKGKVTGFILFLHE